MSSRFNTLYLGQPGEAADALEDFSNGKVDVDELRLALINALRRIELLTERLTKLAGGFNV